jgi:hypothetical protein
VPYVMAQAGHSDPKMTLGVYAQVMPREPIMESQSTASSAPLIGRTMGAQTQNGTPRSLRPLRRSDKNPRASGDF